jgi:hypothetical protein
VASQLTVAVLASGPIRSKRLTREGFPSPPPGYAAVREPPANRPMVPACCRGGSPDRHSRPLTACSSARPSGRPTWLSGSLRASRTRRERTRSAGVAGSLSRKEIVDDEARASTARGHGCADSSRPRGAVRFDEGAMSAPRAGRRRDHVLRLRAARRRSEHAEGCCVAPEHGWLDSRAAPRVSRSPSSRMVFCGREPTKTVPVHSPMVATSRPAATTAALARENGARKLIDGAQ